MKKILVVLSMFAVLLNAGETKLYLGAGPYVQSQPYRHADPVVTPSPVIFFDNRLFYVRWTRVGMYFMGDSSDDFSWGASLTAQPRPFGYEAGDSSALDGMDERKTSWEGGLAVAAEYKKYFTEFLLVHDLLDNSNGTVARAEFGATLKTGKYSFYPSALVIYRSKTFNNYYYGVKPEEAAVGRPAYSAGSGVEFALQSYIKYDISENWHALVNLRADYLGSETRNSPIVDDIMMYSGLVSVMYSFTPFSEK